MSTSTIAPVRNSADASVVRAWLIANPAEGETIGSRGRFSAEQITRYNKANRGSRRYVQGVRPDQTGQEVTGRDMVTGKKKTVKVSTPKARKVLAERGVTVTARGRLRREFLLLAANLTD